MLLTARYAWGEACVLFNTAAMVFGARFRQPLKRNGGSAPPLRPRELQRCAALLGAVTRGDALFRRVLRCRCLDHRPNYRLVRGDPVTDHVPFLPVPLDELHCAASLMVHA